jgi:hypothetical protein
MGPLLSGFRRVAFGLNIFLIAASAMADEQDATQMRYLFAGMSQERAKLKSWSCSITGKDIENLAFDMKLLSNGDSVRFSRTKNKQVEHGCANHKEVVDWFESARQCTIQTSVPLGRQLMHLWDPRTAGLRPDSPDMDYQRTLDRGLELWRDGSKVTQREAFRIITFTKPLEWQDNRLSLTIDTRHGFTPVSYRGDSVYKPNSNFPGKVEVYYEVTAKWKLMSGVWVPVLHRETLGDGSIAREYNISWDWINKDIDDREFTIDALGVPRDVKTITFNKNKELFAEGPAFIEDPRHRGSPWIRWTGYAIGLLLIAGAIWFRFRSKRTTVHSS